MSRKISALLVIALLMAACGATGLPVGESTTTTEAVSPTDPTTSVPATSPVSTETSTTQAPATTTTAPSSATTTAPSSPTTAAPAPATMQVAPWFLIDEAGSPNRSGPFLLPVAREIPHTVAVGRASLEQLFAGPGAGEQSGVPAISTTIPSGVRVLGLTIKEGIATVDLSTEFGGTEASPVVAQRMAQVIFTLTSIPHVTEVLFRQGGKPIKAQTSQGQLVDRPVLKADFLDFAAELTVESPVYGGRGSNPLHVTGFGAVFEAAFNWALTDDDGVIIAEGHEMTTLGTGWGGFDFKVSYKVDKKQVGALIVWTHSAKDGSRIDIREYPVSLVP